MRATVFSLDGRWLAVGLLLAYYALLGLTGPPGELTGRWRRAGVYAHPLPFVDLQVFPAARATMEKGDELYGASSTDPLNRPYNYPRAWLVFMRFPASDAWLRGIGCALGVVAVAALVLFWGRLSTTEGLLGGLLLCSPAFQLGIERGNTDLAMLVLVATGVWLAGDDKRRWLTAALWWTAGILKLYPILALGAWFEGAGRAWLRRIWLPAGFFAAYLALTWHDLVPILRNTGSGWVQSYGCEVLAAAWTQAAAYYGAGQPDALPLAGAGRMLAVVGLGWMLLRGWRQGLSRQMPETETSGAARRAQLGFRVGSLIYLGTFLAGSSFDYRLCFLLLTLPQLFTWQRAGRRLAAVTLVALLFSLGLNYLLAGWPGFFLQESAAWLLFLMLAAQLAQGWRRAAQVRA